ncbi:uncharacterized protein LOC126895701 isoform X2 [Daktulosphaira vitifoliae]|nr:uncharacterized protein LOC126895701 isoform X2 [Daktulosphaira vitifoliae]
MIDQLYTNSNHSVSEEIELIIIRNNLLVCNCLRILPTIKEDYVSKMTEFIKCSKLYLFENHIPLIVRLNFVCNTLYWYWLKPSEIPDYCYNGILNLVNDTLLKVLQDTGKNVINLSSHVGQEQNVLHCLENISNMFICLDSLIVVECIEVTQILLLIFLTHQSCISLFFHFILKVLSQAQNIINSFKFKKNIQNFNCFKFGLLKINSFLSVNHINSIIGSLHISLCIGYILEHQYQEVITTLINIDQYIEFKDELFCLLCYVQAVANFNLEDYESTFYYLAQMDNCTMDLFMRSRCYLLLGRTYSKVGNSDMAIDAFEKLKDSKYNKIMAFYMFQHYEKNNMEITHLIVLDQVLKEDCDISENITISFSNKLLLLLHPEPDVTNRELLYLAAQKKYQLGKYKLAAIDFETLINSNDVFNEHESKLIPIPSNFMLKNEAVIIFLKAHEMNKAFTVGQNLIEEYDYGCDMWISNLFWANELNSYNYNVIGSLLLAETGFIQHSDIILGALNKSFNCLYTIIERAQLTCDENIKTLRRKIMGKVLLHKATILSRLTDREEECETVFNKAIKYNPGDEDIIYLFSKWLEQKGKLIQSINVRDCFDKNMDNTLECENIVLNHVLECSMDLENTIIGNSVIDDLFADTDEKTTDINSEMNPQDDDIFNDLFVD